MQSRIRIGWTSLIVALLIASCRATTQQLAAPANPVAAPVATPAPQVAPQPGLAPNPTPTFEAAAHQARPSTQLQAAFAAAAKEFSAPESILLAVSFEESRWEQHGGQP